MVWRWYQIAAHQPFFRAHAHLDSKRREPWVFEEPWTGRMRNAIRMRYRLLPLWNLLFYKASVNGEPPMRPIWYNYPTVRFCTFLNTFIRFGTFLYVLNAFIRFFTFLYVLVRLCTFYRDF